MNPETDLEEVADGRQVPEAWNRHSQVADLEAEVARLASAGVPFRTPRLMSRVGGAARPVSGDPLDRALC